MPSIYIAGMDKCLKKLKTIEEAAKFLTAPMRRSLTRLRKDLKTYPAKFGKVPFPGFVSARQRRWFFWALRTGRITVPYRRTMTLGRRWTDRIVTWPIFYGSVGNVTHYGPYVQDPDKQAMIHKGRWPTTDDVMKKNQKAIKKDFADHIHKGVEG